MSCHKFPWIQPPAGEQIWELVQKENKTLLEKFWQDSMIEDLVVVDEESEEKLLSFVAAVNGSHDPVTGNNLMKLLWLAAFLTKNFQGYSLQGYFGWDRTNNANRSNFCD